MRIEGYGVNGSTAVSKTVGTGSSPVTPAIKYARFDHASNLFLYLKRADDMFDRSYGSQEGQSILLLHDSIIVDTFIKQYRWFKNAYVIVPKRIEKTLHDIPMRYPKKLYHIIYNFINS